METLNRQSLELEIANAVAKYHREQQGKAPGRIKVTICGNMVYVLCEDTYSLAEEELKKTEEGRKLIKSARRDHRALTRDAAHVAVSRVVGCPVIRSFWDLDVRVGEQLEAYVLDEDIEQRFSGDSA